MTRDDGGKKKREKKNAHLFWRTPPAKEVLLRTYVRNVREIRFFSLKHKVDGIKESVSRYMHQPGSP